MGITELSIFDSVLVALFFMAVTMAVLVGIYAAIRLFSLVFGSLSKKEEGQEAEKVLDEQVLEQQNDLTAGELKLYDVDERTAAAVMAIVSHESGIPLAELRFKSIKPV